MSLPEEGAVRLDSVETLGRDPCFTVAVSPEQLRKEKEKAQVLRRSQWWKRQLARGVCHYCGRPVPPSELTMDHVVPLVRGGKSTRGNTVTACKECNSKKKYLLPLEWDGYLRCASKNRGRKIGEPEQESKGG